MNDNLIENLLNQIENSSSLLFVWSGSQVPNDFKQKVEKFQQRVEPSRLKVEHLDRLNLSNYESSTFDFILSNLLTPINHETSLLTNYLKLLKPKGLLVLNQKETENLESELKLTGFKEITKQEEIYFAKKANFEPGSSSKLKFSTKPKVWQFSANDIQEDDLINTDDLLDDLDLKKPVNVDKFDCGTSASGKKKACKNCSCGLAEELENEAAGKQKKNTEQPVKSACGSCYLGDAFRCASCPYLGMPAFKPGEKVQLGTNLMNSDL